MTYAEVPQSTDLSTPWSATGTLEDLPMWSHEVLATGGSSSITRPSVEVCTDPVVVGDVLDSPVGTLVSVRCPIDHDLGDDAYTRAAIQSYRVVFETLEALGSRFPVRMWNFVPHINEMVSPDLNRYMQFNLGRHQALADWYGSPEALKQLVATASGVGHGGDDLAIHCLALKQKPGVNVENPRQIPAYNYSSRFGPASPSFARATLAEWPSENGRPDMWLMAGGTASVVGEESRHVGELTKQLDVTLENIAALVTQAQSQISIPTTNGSLENVLGALSSIRVYYVQPSDLPAIQSTVSAAFTNVTECQYLHAQLCREELLVEIEGAGAVSVDQAVQP